MQYGSFFLQEIQLGEGNKVEAINHPECPVCTAKDNTATPVRVYIDKYLINHSIGATVRMMGEMGIRVGPNVLKTHMNKHSPYILEFKANLSRSLDEAIEAGISKVSEDIVWDPDDVLQTIINIGGQRIKTGDMSVDSKLLMGALKEQGTRKKNTAISILIDELEAKRFPKRIEGEVAEEGLDENKI